MKILFISQQASRTGAPIVLLHFLKWFKANTNIPFLIAFKEGGELVPEFAALAPVINLDLSRKLYGERKWKDKVLNSLGFKVSLEQKKQSILQQFKRQLLQEDIKLIYSNTVANGEVLESLSSLECPVITHIHELENGILRTGGEKNFNQVKHYTKKYIAVAEAVKKNLVENHAIAANNIELIYEFIPTQLSLISQPPMNHVREELGISPEALIVGASGSLIWRKGVDLFVQLARAVNQRQLDVPVHFVWVGGGIGENTVPGVAELLYEAKQLNLEKYVHFIGSRSNPLDYFQTFDVFTLLSREDPYPLVMLEAAAVGKPIVCFDSSGGAREFVEEDCGFVVPYLDMKAMADQVVILLESSQLRQNLGKNAAEKVQQRHDVSIAAPKVLDLIEHFIP